MDEATVERIVTAVVKAIKEDQHADDSMPLRTDTTPARIAIGHAGPRLKTQTYLRFRADHAIARDAVLQDVPQELLDKLQLPTFKTKCNDKNEFLTRPDLGRQLDGDTLRALKRHNPTPCDALVYAADGLSSKAVAANLEDLLPILQDGLKQQNIAMGRPFFLRYGRVGSMDAIGPALGAKAVCVLLGERPGLGSAESMSAYIAYEPAQGMPEARRTVVSNIYAGGLNAVEAGAYLSEMIGKILAAKKSGVELNEK
ncbi:MAG: ethanolamine ammonia-lyase subunit EutC [Oscillospiraceae bacterium]|jgi:ethanolamine ammonia-lyase small subunit|nr:ethanolamine ammonia-lyase subunit EutC [Oscillospiraceae bacterium]